MSTDPASTWSPDPARFVQDLEAKPDALRQLARSAEVPARIEALARPEHGVLFLGMGSSRYAAEDSARRLRAAGLQAVAEYASARPLPPPDPRTLVVTISASGTSRETIAAATAFAGRAPTVALTEDPGSPLAQLCDRTVPLAAGHEAGGVACRSFQHTGLILRLMEARLTAKPLDFAGLCHRVADASADVLERRPEWLPRVSDLLDGPDGVHVIAPAERWSCAAQSALMFREGPRRPATASETGDWNHVDVYLTKTTDYRALLLTGSRHDDEAMDWLRRRGSIVVTLGRPRTDVAATIEYPGCDDEAVAAHTETLVAELLAARWWAAAS